MKILFKNKIHVNRKNERNEKKVEQLIELKWKSTKKAKLRYKNKIKLKNHNFKKNRKSKKFKK